MDNSEAYVILNLLPGIGPLRVNQLLTLFGEPAAVLRAPAAQLARVHGIGDRVAATICNWRAHCDPARERELARRGGVTIVTREDGSYPPLLREIHDPPLCLYVRGSLPILANLKRGLAIVGSRRTTDYGVRMAENLAAAAGLAGWTVVSGLARGIDTVAHEATLAVKGCTVAVLGSGLAHVYPQENIELARRIAAGNGALVSEFPMTFRPDKRTFPMRNRIISGMTLGTLVIEAGQRSGSLITATQALEQNRQVFAVPGRVDSPQSRGCHGLIKDGAKLVEHFDDVLDEFAPLPGLGCAAARPGTAATPTLSQRDFAADDLNLSVSERRILTFLDDAPEAAVDDVIATLGEPAAKVLGAIVSLEMRRLVRQLPGKRIAKCARTLAG